MNSAPVNLWICLAGPTVQLRVTGRAGFQCSADFKRVIHELAQKGRRRFVVDLSACLMMDSTFLGVLISFVKTAPAASQPGPEITLLKPNQRVRDLLDNLGVAEFFKVAEQVETPECELAPAPAAPAATKEELTRTSLEAHQALIAANPDNLNRFKDVVQFLAEDLKKLADGK